MEKSPAAGGARDPELFGGIQDLSEGQLVEVRRLDESLVVWKMNRIFPNTDDDPISLSYFSEGLKPPTSI